MNKIKYEKPYIEVIKSDNSEIVTTSGVIPTKLTDALFGAGKDGVNVG